MHARNKSTLRNSLLLTLLPVVLLTKCAPPSRSGRASPLAGPATYTNPVWPEDFADPTIIRARDGWYYAYGTQTRRNGHDLNLQVARSADLVSWEHLGDALPVKPAWAHTTYSFWAPHVSEVGNTYYLYYSAKPDQVAANPDPGANLCLAVATATSPAGPFTDSGRPLQCGESFVNIDPMQFDDPVTGRRLLYWGSGFGPLKVRELAPDRVSFLPDSPVINLVYPDSSSAPGNYQRLVEGSWVTYHEGWYYLLFSGDNCCGPSAHYAVMVARSHSATGPFQTQAAATQGRVRTLLARNARWLAPGHNSVVQDAAGQPWLAYHAIDATLATDTARPNYSRRVLLLDRLTYTADGWLQVRPAGTPSVGPEPVPRRR